MTSELFVMISSRDFADLEHLGVARHSSWLDRMVARGGCRQVIIAAASVACPLLASLACFGVMGYAGVRLTVLSAMALFLSIGIALDDVFLYVPIGGEKKDN